MTQVGHSLAGASFGILLVHCEWRLRAQALFLACLAVLANLPDLRLPGWGHERYDISHSVFVNGGLIALVCLILLSFRRVRERPGIGRVLTGGALAWLSHLLLDSFYGHGKGIAIFWPFSQARLNLPIPWFETVQVTLPRVDAHSLRVWGIEFVSYGLVLAFAVAVRSFRGRRACSGTS